MNPYTMWQEQTPRQIYELLRTYKELHKDDEGDKPKPSKDGRPEKVSSSGGKTYKKVGNPKIPEWLKIPEGATVYNADTVTQEEMMSND